MPITPSKSICALDDRFYDPVEAAPFPKHLLRFRNDRAAQTIGLQDLTRGEWIAHFGRFEPLEGTLQTPLALRYHGHQFRSYNPQLGDGRGFLFAQYLEHGSGRLMDLGTKGSGKTPWSRTADGRLTLKGAVREILAAEMLEARGVPTCRILSVIETGEQLIRHDEPSPTRAAVLVRLSHSHIRFGAFQRLAYHKDHDGILQLARYCAQHYYPDLVDRDPQDLVEGLLQHATDAMATTVAGWMAAGFVHGVLNTDNMNITGESFDYGPWRFLPHVDQMFTAAYFDHGRLYAYGRQPNAVLWNLARLAECLLPWSSIERLTPIIDRFGSGMLDRWKTHFFRLLGVRPATATQNRTTFQNAMQFLESSQAPYDQFLFDWFGGVELAGDAAHHGPNAPHYTGEAFEAFIEAFRRHPPQDSAHNPRDTPYYQRGVPASLHIDRVEAIWDDIAQNDDWSAFETTIARIRESAI